MQPRVTQALLLAVGHFDECLRYHIEVTQRSFLCPISYSFLFLFRFLFSLSLQPLGLGHIHGLLVYPREVPQHLLSLQLAESRAVVPVVQELLEGGLVEVRHVIQEHARGDDDLPEEGRAAFLDGVVAVVRVEIDVVDQPRCP